MDTLNITWQIICIDDGSSDDTLNILNGLSKEIPNIQAYSFTRNFGHQATVSAGFSVSNAGFTIAMDSAATSTGTA